MRTHGLTKDATYKVWQSMRQRCENPNCDSYADYGGRGITVTPEWQSFEGFVRDMGLSPPGATLDRINNNRGYEKANCRWVSLELQAQNRRSVQLTVDAVREIRRRAAAGERSRLLAREFGTSEPNLSNVLSRRSWKNVE
jgi:hypothetical protein